MYDVVFMIDRDLVCIEDCKVLRVVSKVAHDQTVQKRPVIQKSLIIHTK